MIKPGQKRSMSEHPLFLEPAHATTESKPIPIDEGPSSRRRMFATERGRNLRRSSGKTISRAPRGTHERSKNNWPTRGDFGTPSRRHLFPEELFTAPSPACRRKPESELSAFRHRPRNLEMPPSQCAHPGAQSTSTPSSVGMPARCRRRCEAPTVYQQSVHIAHTTTGGPNNSGQNNHRGAVCRLEPRS